MCTRCLKRTCCWASTLGAVTGANALFAPSAAPEVHTTIRKKQTCMRCVIGKAKILPVASLLVVWAKHRPRCRLQVALWLMKCGYNSHMANKTVYGPAPLLARITRARRQASSTRTQQLELTRLLHCWRASMVPCIHSIYLRLLLPD